MASVCLLVLMRQIHNAKIASLSDFFSLLFSYLSFSLVSGFVLLLPDTYTAAWLLLISHTSLMHLCPMFWSSIMCTSTLILFLQQVCISVFLCLPLKVNEVNISQSMLSDGFPKPPGHSQPPTWISLANSLQVLRKRGKATSFSRSFLKCRLI